MESKERLKRGWELGEGKQEEEILNLPYSRTPNLCQESTAVVEKKKMRSGISLGAPSELQVNKIWAQALQDYLQFHTRFNVLAIITKQSISMGKD